MGEGGRGYPNSSRWVSTMHRKRRLAVFTPWQEQNLAVYAACREGDVEALQRLFPDNPPQWKSPEGGSLLHQVVRIPHLHVLDWLWTFSPDVNKLADYGLTPLMLACNDRQELAARWLLDHGAHTHAAPFKWTPLHYACSREWVNGVALLLQHGADPDTRDHQNCLPEDYWSVSSPHYATFCTLLDDARRGYGLK
jgi:ankyrin repeat protein